jgi:glycosyltransferase involved in cell wall biosynthesis
MNIAFLGFESTKWMGGIYYLKNLLYSMQINENKKFNISPIIFLSENYDASIIALFEPYAQCIILRKYKPIPFSLKLIDKFLKKKTKFFLNYYLSKYKIDIVSHSEIDYGKIKTVKKIGWIPDFQDKHLPQLFSKSELYNRDVKYRSLIKHSDVMICSSYDAAKDLNTFYPGAVSKTRVLQFVSQIDASVYEMNDDFKKRMELKYNFSGKFFYLPNKFYKHKNHITVFEAINELKKSGIEVLIICTGEFSAFESEDYIDELSKFIDNNNLNDNIRILGLVDHKEVRFFLRYSVSVINPSLFEGWSTTVEDCKSLGKNMIISDIAVHREQDPPDTIYFDPEDVKGLTNILRSKWISSDGGPDFDLEDKSMKDIHNRTKHFGDSYIKILNEVFLMNQNQQLKTVQ